MEEKKKVLYFSSSNSSFPYISIAGRGQPYAPFCTSQPCVVAHGNMNKNVHLKRSCKGEKIETIQSPGINDGIDYGIVNRME